MFALSALRSVFYLKIFLWNVVMSEWVDMPQFSDEKRVYRLPSSTQNYVYKFTQENADKQSTYGYQDVTFINSKMEQTIVNKSAEDVFVKAEETTEQPAINANLHDKTIKRINFGEYDTMLMNSNIEEEEVNNKYINETLISSDTGILNYLPVNILKNVHHTLKLQSKSSEGKVQFLKSFEKSLMMEIESRLAKAIASGREKRGADHYDHNYDNHDHPVGFPSIEGALMAISFLTFAVYLVRLVMLLFRNMNNTPTNNNGATVLLGRRKRSEDSLDYDMNNILNGVDNFFSAL